MTALAGSALRSACRSSSWSPCSWCWPWSGRQQAEYRRRRRSRTHPHRRRAGPAGDVHVVHLAGGHHVLELAQRRRGVAASEAAHGDHGLAALEDEGRGRLRAVDRHEVGGGALVLLEVLHQRLVDRRRRRRHRHRPRHPPPAPASRTRPPGKPAAVPVPAWAPVRAAAGGPPVPDPPGARPASGAAPGTQAARSRCGTGGRDGGGRRAERRQGVGRRAGQHRDGGNRARKEREPARALRSHHAQQEDERGDHAGHDDRGPEPGVVAAGAGEQGIGPEQRCRQWWREGPRPSEAIVARAATGPQRLHRRVRRSPGP